MVTHNYLFDVILTASIASGMTGSRVGRRRIGCSHWKGARCFHHARVSLRRVAR